MSSLTWKADTEKLFLPRPAKVPQLSPTFPCFLLPAMRPCVFFGRCVHSWSSCPACGATLPKQAGESCSGTCVCVWGGAFRRNEIWLGVLVVSGLPCLYVLYPCTVVKRTVGIIIWPQPREGGAGSAGRIPSVSQLHGVFVTVLE